MECNGKNSYRSEHEARKVRRIVGKTRNTKLRVYQCTSCHNWHLTSAPKFDTVEKSEVNKYEE